MGINHMEEDQPKGFKIGLDQPEIEAEKQPAGKPRKQSPNTGPLIAFLGFLIIGVVMVWVYYDIQNRLQTINTSGTEEVARLSREVNNKIAGISNRLSAIEKSSHKELSDIKLKIRDTNGRIDKLQASLASFEKNLGSLNQNINPLKDQVKKFSQVLGGIDETAQSLKDAQTQINNQLKNHSAEIKKLSETMVHQEKLDKILKKEREFYKQNMAHATEALFSEVASFEDKLKTIRENLDHLEKRMIKMRQSLNEEGLQEPVENSDAGLSPSETMPVPENGEIVEQEIE